MMYMLSGIELHPDFGFGVTGDSYYHSAVHLKNNHYENYKVTQQKEMPGNFLLRHSIELYLKSLIIIFHKKLEINYDQESFNSSKPKILTNGKWRDLYTCHWIDELYNYWLNSLLIPNQEKLKKIAPRDEWKEEKAITNLFPIICKYDRDSSFFRYPVTKDTSLDKDKFTMKRLDKVKSFKGFMEDFMENQDKDNKQNLGRKFFLKIDGNDNVTDAFKEDETVLENVSSALSDVAYYFHCIHIMSRVILCGGM